MRASAEEEEVGDGMLAAGTTALGVASNKRGS